MRGGDMGKSNLNECANEAIRETVRKWRPGKEKVWMILVGNTTLTIPEIQEWMHFIGDVLERYHACSSPCVGPMLDTLATYHTEQLIALRDAIVEGTKCP